MEPDARPSLACVPLRAREFHGGDAGRWTGDDQQDEESERRLKYTAGMSEPSYGIYDEILERTEPRPESLREALRLPNGWSSDARQGTRHASLVERIP